MRGLAFVDALKVALTWAWIAHAARLAVKVTRSFSFRQRPVFPYGTMISLISRARL